MVSIKALQILNVYTNIYKYILENLSHNFLVDILYTCNSIYNIFNIITLITIDYWIFLNIMKSQFFFLWLYSILFYVILLKSKNYFGQN